MSFQKMMDIGPAENAFRPRLIDDRSEGSTLPLPTRIALVGNYLPREYGIATFTTDLCSALTEEFGQDRLFAIPVSDPDSIYDYPGQVRLELAQEDLASYERAAEFLNFNGNDLVVCSMNTEFVEGSPAARSSRYCASCCKHYLAKLATTRTLVPESLPLLQLAPLQTR